MSANICLFLRQIIDKIAFGVDGLLQNQETVSFLGSVAFWNLFCISGWVRDRERDHYKRNVKWRKEEQVNVEETSEIKY